MRRRAFVAAALIVPVAVGAWSKDVDAAVGDRGEVVALIVEGVGNGHGRGLSQWGAYGWAVTFGLPWQQILDHYYAGTVLGDAATSTSIGVRLTALDDATTTGVISTTRSAMWNGVGYGALYAREMSPNRYDVLASASPACPGETVAWTLLSAGVTGPVTFTTPGDQSSTPADHALGLCQPAGSIVHYRGSITALNDSAGANRTVNELLVENYVRGVVSREVSAGWGDAGGRAGMNALRAQAVAARSFGLSQSRYTYADTCDTSICQVYGGAAYRAAATAPFSFPGSRVCELGNDTFECANTDLAVAETAGKIRRWPDGRVVSTEFSASNGPRTAGGAFPAVDDPADDVPANPNHRWTRVIDADLVESRYGLGSLDSAITARDPISPYDGIWGNEVRFRGSAGTTAVAASDFRNAYGLPSPGFTIRAVTRDVVTGTGFTFIGDSVGVSLTETGTSELPALLDGVFPAPRYDAVGGRCTAPPGCVSTGLAAASAVPAGSGLVVVELGLNDASNFAAKLDQVMQVLRSKGVRTVIWLNVSQRTGTPVYATTNQALLDAQARWPELIVVNWNAISRGNTNNQDRWFTADAIHLTSTGQAELARVIRDQVVGISPRLVSPSTDGRTDVLLRYTNGTSWLWDVGLSTGSSFRPAGNWLWGRGGTPEPVYTGDFDGDGRTDVLLRYTNGTSWLWDVGLSTGSSFRPAGNWFWARGGTPEPVYTGDFDGDGRTDVLLRYTNGTSWLWDVGLSTGSSFRPAGNWFWARGGTPEPVYTGDFDGDGRTDVLLRYTNGTSWLWDVGLSTGSSFRPAGNWFWGRGGTPEPVYTGDFDGDGRTDVLLRYTNGTSWLWDVGLSTGSGFTPAGNWYWGRGGTPEPVYVGDFDGDGRDDVLLRYGSGLNYTWDVGLSTGSGFTPAGNWYWGRGGTPEPVYVGDFEDS